MAKQPSSRGAASKPKAAAKDPEQPRAQTAAPAVPEGKKQDAKKIRKLIDLGKERGYLTYTEVNEAVPREGSTPEELDSVMSMLGDMDIEVVESMDEEGFAPEEAET